MAEVFHLFPYLPWELRDHIWKLAVRPCLPGAHVFRVYNWKDSERVNPKHEVASKNAPWRHSPSRIAAPRCVPRGADYNDLHSALQALRATTPISPPTYLLDSAPISWTLNNPSTYLIDSGLWTACQESLRVIEAEFRNPARRRATWTPSEVEAFRKRRARFNLPETVTISVSVNSKRRYITVFPAHDLFIVQVHDILDVPWYFIREYFLQCFHMTEPSDHSRRHMALEYDPMWDKVAHDSDHREEGPARDFITGLISSNADGYGFNLWFIDYRIKRNPRYREITKAQTEGPGVKPPAVFYAGDRRYVEVNAAHVGRWAGHGRMWDAGYEIPREDICSYCGPHGIIERIEDRFDEYMDDPDYWEPEGSGPDHDVTYGVLACEYL